MSRNFGIQISPELILNLTQPHHQHPQHRRPPAPKPRLKPHPKPQPTPTPPPETLALPSPIPDPTVLLPRLLPGSAPEPQDSIDIQLEPFRKTVAETQEAVVILRKHEEAYREEVKRRAGELHEKEYRIHKPKPVPCKETEQACIRCYEENRGNPLKCAENVRAYVECSRQVRQRFVAAGFD